MKSTDRAQPLAIVGMGCMFPKADNINAYWNNIKNRVDAITDIPDTHWATKDYFDKDPKKADHTYAAKGGFISSTPFPPLDFGVLPNSVEATDTSQLLSMLVVEQALEDAGYGKGLKNFNRDRVSVVLGVTGALELVVPLGARLGHPIWRKALEKYGIDSDVTEEIVQEIGDSYVGWQENSFPGLLGNVVAGRIANHFDFGGSNCVVDAACASSLSALHMASMELSSGASDMVITGGIDTFNSIFMYMCFSKTSALSPQGHAKPFATDGDGTILSEGLGIMVVKRLADAERDGNKIYAVVKSIGSSSDGKGQAIYAPSDSGQAKAIKKSHEIAGITPDTIELVEGHGTGTKVGDGIEANALIKVFEETKKPGTWCALGSVKSQIGHTKAAAGAAGVIKSALALYNKTLPPTIKIQKPIEQLQTGKSPFYLNAQTRPWLPSEKHPRRAGVSSFGFGGSNFHCILEEYKGQQIHWDGETQILTFSSDEREQLQVSLNEVSNDLDWLQLRIFAGKKRLEFSTKHQYRLVLVINRSSNIKTLIESAQQMLSKYPQKKNWQTPNGIYFGSGSPEKLGMLFSGQGSQYVEMFKDLTAQFPHMAQTIATMDNNFQSFYKSETQKVSDIIYPLSSFAENESVQHQENLKNTEIAQPAIGAVSLGLFKLLQYFSVTPDAVAGHSYGELTALCAANVLSEEDFCVLSLLRGQLMSQSSEQESSMLAVQSTLEIVSEVIDSNNIEVVIANKNAPQQFVLSGTMKEIDKASQILNDKKIRNKKLSVSNAFHSPLMENAKQPFLEKLNKVNLNSGSIPVFANSTGTKYPKEAQEMREVLAKQIVNSVEFINEIEAMYKEGIRTFLEVGPGATLTGLTKSILADKEHEAFSVNNSKNSEISGLAQAIAKLASLGHEISLEKWDEKAHLQPTTVKKKSAFTIPICGANYVKPKPPRPVKKIQKALPKSQPQVEPPKVAKLSSQPSSPQKTPITSPSTPKKVNRPKKENIMSQRNNIQPLPGVVEQIQKNIIALQQIQQQNSELHRLYLENQDKSRESIQQLITQQNNTFTGSNFTESSVPAPVSIPIAPNISSANNGTHTQVQTSEVSQIPSKPVATQIKSVVTNRKVNTKVQKRELPQNQNVQNKLLEVIAEKTGYPSEMLEMAMELDSDLGIDSIKRVEIFSALQEQLPNAPEIESQDLGSLKTLGDVVDFLSVGGETTQTTTVVSDSKVQQTLLEVIAEKTGYPSEMLEMTMELDSDLGIDSIKRVEIFSALQEQLPNAPEIESQDLGSLKTLGDVVDFLSVGSKATQTTTVVSNSKVQQTLLGVIAEKTGYPSEMLEMTMELDSDLGIDSIKRVEIFSALQEQLPNAPEIESQDLGSLKTLGDVVDFLSVGSEVTQTTLVKLPSNNKVQETLLEVIAEKTGYPSEMLEMTMELDSDLGIDSIKRVEIFSALQEQLPNAPEIESQDLGSLKTLGDVVNFLSSGSESTQVTTVVNDNKVQETLLEVIAEKTGYPSEMLEMTMELDNDLGIDSIKRVEIFSALQEALPNAPEIGSEDLGNLKTIKDVVEFLSTGQQQPTPQVSAPIKSAKPEKVVEEKPIYRSILKLQALEGKNRPKINISKAAKIAITQDDNDLSNSISKELKNSGYNVTNIAINEDCPVDIDILIIVAPISNNEDFLENSFILLQKAQKLKNKDQSIVVTISRIDGAFGLIDADKGNPNSGGLAGLLKTISHEWPNVHAKAIDVAPGIKSATDIITEIFTQGPLEVGIAAKKYTLALEQTPLSQTINSNTQLNAGDVVVVSGGARGVTAEAAISLGRKFKPTIIMLGRTPLQNTPQWLNNDLSEAEIKKKILSTTTKKLSPKELQQQYKTLAGQCEIANNIERIKATGAAAVYYSIDIRDEQAMNKTLSNVVAEFGKIKGIVHGAGVIADDLIENKTIEQFRRVYQTKVGGLQNIIDMVDFDELKWMVLFSSTTARYGRTGQLDYAVANEVLNKIAQQQACLHPKLRVLSINWGPWEGGMVTPALRKIFAKEGVGLIPLRGGADYMVEELCTNSNKPVEITILGESNFSNQPAKTQQTSSLKLSFSRKLTIKDYPFLQSHVINNRAVVPMAMMIEWLGHGALHQNPGFTFLGFDNLRVLKGILLNKGSEREIKIFAGKAQKQDGNFIVPVELRSETEVHASANFLLSTKLPKRSTAIEYNGLPSYERNSENIYRDILFHGSHFQGIRQIEGYHAQQIVGTAKNAPRPNEWFQNPLRSNWLTDPLVLDVSFQMMIVWTFEKYGMGSLPCHIGKYRQVQKTYPQSDTKIIIQVTKDSKLHAVADMEFVDGDNNLIAYIKDYECTIDTSLNNSFRSNQLT
ncbi:SDR family NAD(P)-dependent oxidoreductase [Candidatus Uabimicrobium sp. HlEnr_7]|uniref:SDR family NAD(P)-dependent oxidoreductase n=1 Tax=Candidatus Uabimicrobium helgolandensis TaxID=3095367 RepID=UPI0035569901